MSVCFCWRVGVMAGFLNVLEAGVILFMGIYASMDYMIILASMVEGLEPRGEREHRQCVV